MFEADRIPPPWVALSKTHSLTIVPVDSCRQAWVASGAPADKIKICPLGVDRDHFKPGLKPIKLVAPNGRNALEYKVRFLNVADVSSRKNLIGLLRAWLTTTNDTDDAALILKPGFYSPTANGYLTKQILQLEEAEGKTLLQAAPIFWITGVLSAQIVPSLYATATHYISASFGEGFDQPMVEAAASGLQLVAPRHSAYLDYLNDEIAYMISAKDVPADFPDDPRTNVFFVGTNWWQPSHEELCATIRNIIDGQGDAKKSARDSVLSRFSWSSTAELLERLIFE